MKMTNKQKKRLIRRALKEYGEEISWWGGKSNYNRGQSFLIILLAIIFAIKFL